MKWLRENNLYSFMVVLVFASFITVNAAEELSFFGKVHHKYKELSFSCRRLYGQLYKKLFIFDQKKLNRELFDAAQRGSVEGVDAALCAGADANAIFDPKYCYCEQGEDRDSIRRYLGHASLLLNVCGNFKLLSPRYRIFLLGEAVTHKREDQVRALLDVGTYVNAPPLFPGQWSLLHLAACSNAQICQLLIDAGAEFSAVNLCNGKTPLCQAAQVGNVEVVKTLLAAGASIEGAYTGASSRFIRSPLEKALSNGKSDAAEVLLDAGANFNSCSLDAVKVVKERQCSADVLDLLIKRGLISVTSTTSFSTGLGSGNRTAPMDLYQAAVDTGQYDKVSVLLKRGVKSDLSSFSELSKVDKSRLEELGHFYDEHRMVAEEFLDESSSGKLYRDVKDVIMTDMLGQQRMTDSEVEQLRRDKLDRHKKLLDEIGLW